MLIRKAQTSKKIQLNVDSVSYWMATNNAKDNVLKRQYFELYGIPNGLRRLAHDYPFSPHRTSEPRPAAAHPAPRTTVAVTQTTTGVLQ